MPPLRATIIPVTQFQQNCTLLWSEATKRGAVIDPGGDVGRILTAIETAGVEVDQILLTHGHIDHAGGAAELKERLGAPVAGPHEADRVLLENLAETGRAYGISGSRDLEPDRWLAEGDRITVADVAFDVLHCPGHSPGSIVLVDTAHRFALVGDVLFRGSVGRTDLPGGDHALLIRSIKQKLLPLGDDISFICGHGPSGTFGEERVANPFLR
jgi:hydroxyacylglutathione hydrolase